MPLRHLSSSASAETSTNPSPSIYPPTCLALSTDHSICLTLYLPTPSLYIFVLPSLSVCLSVRGLFQLDRRGEDALQRVSAWRRRLERDAGVQRRALGVREASQVSVRVDPPGGGVSLLPGHGDHGEEPRGLRKEEPRGQSKEKKRAVCSSFRFSVGRRAVDLPLPIRKTTDRRHPHLQQTDLGRDVYVDRGHRQRERARVADPCISRDTGLQTSPSCI